MLYVTNKRLYADRFQLCGFVADIIHCRLQLLIELTICLFQLRDFCILQQASRTLIIIIILYRYITYGLSMLVSVKP